jgi:hypothetical protein
MAGMESSRLKFLEMKVSILILFLLSAITCKLFAQEVAPSKNKFGVSISTHIFGFDDNPTNVNVGSGLYFSRKISNKFSLYSELAGSSLNYGDVSLMPGLKGEFSTGIIAVYVAPMFDIGKKSTVSLGIVENYLLRSELKTSSITKDVKDETTNYSALLFDFRTRTYKELVLGIRYEWGLNSVLKNTDRRVTTLSFNVFLPLNGKRNQEKNKSTGS